MKSKNALCGLATAVVLQMGMRGGSAQTNIYLYSGSLTNITLNPGTYLITAYGAPGAFPSRYYGAIGGWGGSGAEMSAEFNFSTSTTLTLLVGGGGGDGCNCGALRGGGGGGYSGGGSIIDSSAITILTEVSGILSPDYPYPGPYNGEIIITAVPTPLYIAPGAAFGFTNGVFGFTLIGPSGSNVVIQASTDLQTWMPLQTNLLGSAPLYFSDSQSTTNIERFYRVQFLP